MNEKINSLGSLVQAVRILELAKRDFENLYQSSQVRLPIEDVSFVDDRLKEIKKLVAEIKEINGQFELIATKQHE